jgi:hypothetical protein
VARARCWDAHLDQLQQEAARRCEEGRAAAYVATREGVLQRIFACHEQLGDRLQEMLEQPLTGRGLTIRSLGQLLDLAGRMTQLVLQITDESGGQSPFPSTGSRSRRPR